MLAVNLHKHKKPWLGKGSHLIPILNWKTGSIINFRKILNIDGIPFDRIISTLLLQRGINTYEKARHFFKAGLSDLYDPFLMTDMDKAVKRIEHQIQTKEKILVFGDYDVDGITSVAMVYLFLKNNFPELSIEYYIPDRYTEGYGISIEGIDFAKNIT